MSCRLLRGHHHFEIICCCRLQGRGKLLKKAVGYYVLRAVVLKCELWGIMLFCPSKVNLRFGGPCRLHPQCGRMSRTREHCEAGSKTGFACLFSYLQNGNDIFFRNIGWLLDIRNGVIFRKIRICSTLHKSLSEDAPCSDCATLPTKLEITGIRDMLSLESSSSLHVLFRPRLRIPRGYAETS